MATTPLPSSQVLTFIILLFSTITIHVDAQTTNTNTTSFSCSPNSSTTCNTYVIYRAQSPDLLDTGHISDLFGVSRSLIQRANNLSSEDAYYLPGQLLLVPISCGCSGNQSVAKVSYIIKPADNFYSVSISSFENLTDFQVVGEMNPSLVPTNLKVGEEVLFPLHCKCPTKAQLHSGINHLLTYVWQRGDDISSLSRDMNTTATAIETLNNYRNFTAAVALPILIPVSQLPVFSPPIYNTSVASDVTGRKSRLERTIVVLSATLGVALALALWSLLVLLYCKYGHYRRKALARMGSCLETTDLLHANKKSSDGPASGQSKAVVDKLLFGVSTYLDNPVVYDVEDIMAATMNLDDRYRIDGSVYKATLKGEVFAVKKARGDITEELAILQKLSHANIVKLRGVSVSTQKDGFFLVFENAENTSLERWLFPKKSCSSNSVTFLSWKQRLNIALDVANGLQYMHSHTRPSIVHRDIRSSNILLNARFKAKIANFSMAKPATVGVSPSIDVLAFGGVLLELLSGRRDAENVGALWKEIRMVLEVEEKREKRLKKWMDPKLEGFYPVDGAMSLAAMTRACTSEKASERPSMSEMVFSLSVLAQSCSNDEYERLWISNTEYKVVMTNPVAR